MQGDKSWNERIRKLLSERGWDAKDWRRVTKIDQRVLENLLSVDTTGLPEDKLDSIYDLTEKGKLAKDMLRFGHPVIIAVWAHKGGPVNPPRLRTCPMSFPPGDTMSS